MEAYISLTEQSSNAWLVEVKLPVKWLKQYPEVNGPWVAREPLREKWGDQVTENGQPQPWRHVTLSYESLEAAEEGAVEALAELREAKESLRPKGRIRYVLDLENDGVVIKDLTRENVPTNNEF